MRRAYVYSAKVHRDQFRRNGEPYLNHPLNVSYVLTQLKQGVPAIAAGLLHDTVEDTLTTIQDIQDMFGDEIALLVEGLTKIAKIEFSSKKQAQAENFRKILLAMSEDIRVVLIKLSDRLHNMRTIEFMPPERQREISQETLDIYSPLAYRMGIFWIKAELEDLCLKVLKPDIYRQVEERLSSKIDEYKTYIDNMCAKIKEVLGQNEIRVEVMGRIKHVYSIFHKMEAQNIEFDQVYDIIAFRVIVDSVRYCYESLGVINNTWTPVPGRMKDYIALPKANMYQSLHTTVIGSLGERVEIQIRTWDMHMIAEEGIAAHWRYKEDGRISDKDETAFAWLRQMLEWQRDTKDPSAFLESVKLDLFPEEVYVFTPKGDVKALPRGSTPVDFAFSIHTEVGQHVSGAKVNGKIVPLQYVLKSGDRIDILTSPKNHPSKDWLKFVKTPRARHKIWRWIAQKEEERSIIFGKEILEKELKRFSKNLKKLDKEGEIDKIAAKLGVKDAQQVYASVGFGKLKKDKVIALLFPEEDIRLLREKKKSLDEKAKKKIKSNAGAKSAGGVRISGEDDIMVRFGKCCNPLPGDEILGYITRGRGITVHRVGCPKMLTIGKERLVEVEWKEGYAENRPVRINIVCVDKPGMLAAITSSISTADVNISRAEVRVTADMKATCVFEFNVRSLDHLNKVIKNIEKVKGVIHVERVHISHAVA